MEKGFVYILASQRNGTLYLGVTSNLVQRIYQHKQHIVEGFTQKYDVVCLVWYEIHDSILSAIQREKQLKNGSGSGKWNLLRRKIQTGVISTLRLLERCNI